MPARLLRQYAAVFFFAPLVQLRLGGRDFGLSEGDQNAIRHSIRRGYITFALGISFLIVSGVMMFAPYEWLTRLYRGLMGTTLLSLVIGIWRIHHPNEQYISGQTTIITNHMLTAFIPGYNRYLWYTQQDPHHPYRWLKESILWRYVIMVCLIIPPVNSIGLLVLVIMILRLIILAAGYDILTPKVKHAINLLFTIHVDEL
ncbi:MAG: hypothetical protein H6766_02905 [Candidatus Peribacteria bacterium]|nr:MAG: hypothetical protein H6766_02905 [Candidatus Peribacteria bacterium]